MKRILHIISGLSTGGAESMLYKVLSAIDRKAFDFNVISLIDKGTFGEKIERLGIPVFPMGIKSGNILPPLWRLANTVRKIKPDLIQGWMYHGNMASQLSAFCLYKKVPVFWNIRHSVYDLAYEKRMTAFLIKIGARLSNKPARIIYNSEVIAEQHELLGYRKDKRVLIHNGFDTEEFKPSEYARQNLRTELGLSRDSVLIGLVGRFHPMKDHAGFLSAASMLLKTYPDVHFVLAGRDVDINNPLLVDQARNTGILNNVHLLGERRDVPSLTAALDIASSSSYGEGFPNVIGEAMSCCVPCVVTDVGESASIVGDTGKVVPPRDPVAMADAWRSLIGLGTEKRRQFGIAARKRIEDNFSLPVVVSQYAELYDN